MSSATSFEANLRGKHKKMFSSNSPARKASNSAATSQKDAMPLGHIEDVTYVVLPDSERESNGNGKVANPATASEERVKGEDDGTSQDDASTDGDEEHAYAEDGGDPPRVGWHEFPIIPRGSHPVTVLHAGNDEWLNQNKTKFPLGIRSPEGYMWAQRPEELLWAECAPNFTTRCSRSQIRLLGPMSPEDKDVRDNAALLQELCGKPTMLKGIGYDTHSGIGINIRGVDRLDVYTPLDELPLTLDVFDNDDVTNPGTYMDDGNLDANFDRNVKVGIPILPVARGVKPLKYRLVDPTGKRSMKRMNVRTTNASLVISESRQIGAGSNARVFEGQIGLDVNDAVPSTRYPPKLRIVTKVSTGPRGTEFMRDEARMYNTFPDYFSQEYKGFQIVKPSFFPRRLSQIVPCFYGFYEPVEEGIDGSSEKRAPIILMEDCGSPIDPNTLTQYQKAEIVSMFDRMHHAGFVHQSIESRNILVQPGAPELHSPLNSCPRWARSLRTPSFRMIDLGHSKSLKDTAMQNERVIQEMIQLDVEQLQQAIQMNIPR